MASIDLHALPTSQTAAPATRSAESRAPGRRLRVGIGATLSLAFFAVAILAAAANLISERGLDVVVAPLDGGPSMLAIPPIETAPAAPPAPVDAPTPPTTSLTAALDRVDRAVAARMSASTPAADRELADAVRALHRDRHAPDVRTAARADAPDATAARDGELEKALAAYVAVGAERVRLADERRGLTRDYSTHYEAMRARARTSLDHAWKIFGRVIARQSVITLGRQIEELGALSFAVLASPRDATPADAIEQEAAALAASEEAIATTLTDNERNLTKSQGREWVDAMQADLESLSATRYELMQRRLRVNALERQSIGMKVRLADLQRALDAHREAAAAVEPAAPTAAVQIAPPLLPARHVRYERGAIIAWISAGVLLLLVIIIAATVRSVVGPVAKLLDATARLADGEMDARVPAGGIKELDTLAVAFNEMAERLAQAERVKRDYQLQLEAKVEERTAQLKFLASNDALTALPNQRQLFELLNDALDRALANNALLGVYFLDIDNFKNINDGMGHSFGDKVLQAMAQRLRAVAGEFGFAARLGGDEFTVVFEHAADLDQIREAGGRLVREFHAPLAVDNRDLALSISVGASVFPDHGRTAESLLRAADAALFRAKALGRSQLSMYSPELLEAASAKFAVEQGLRRALERGDFELVFQPEINLDTREVDLVEALIRWRQPDGKLVSPGEFLGVAEESGLIMDISDWVLRTAIATAARWHHGRWPRARVAINVSSRQLIDSHFVERVATLLHEHCLPARCIEIELTETVLQTGNVTLEALRQLRAHGIAIALDDFGTGYSSIASLQRLPLTRIKLDRSLIHEIDTSPRSLAIARSIIGLANSLGLQITAEGIERPTQLELLVRESRMVLQGYLFARPIAEGDLIAALDVVTRRARELLPNDPHDEVARLHRRAPLEHVGERSTHAPNLRLM